MKISVETVFKRRQKTTGKGVLGRVWRCPRVERLHGNEKETDFNRCPSAEAGLASNIRAEDTWK